MVGAAELRVNFKIRLIRQRLKENEMRKKFFFSWPVNYMTWSSKPITYLPANWNSVPWYQAWCLIGWSPLRILMAKQVYSALLLQPWVRGGCRTSPVKGGDRLCPPIHLTNVQQCEGTGGVAAILSRALLSIDPAVPRAVPATASGSPRASTVLPRQVPARVYQIAPVSRKCQQEGASHPKPLLAAPAPS